MLRRGEEGELVIDPVLLKKLLKGHQTGEEKSGIIDTLQKTIDLLETDMKKYKIEQSKKINELKKLNSDKTVQIERNTSKIEQQTEEINVKNTQLEQFKSLNTSLAEELNTTKLNFESAKKEHLKEKELNLQKTRDLQQKLELYQIREKNMDNNYSELQSQKNELTLKLAELQKEFNLKTLQLEQNSNILEPLNLQISDLKNQLEKMQEYCKAQEQDSKTKISQIQVELNEKSTIELELRQKLANEEALKNQLDVKLETLSKQISNLEKQIQTKDKKIIDMDKDILELKENIAEENKKILEKEQNILQLQQKTENLSVKLSDQEKNNTLLTKRNEELLKEKDQIELNLTRKTVQENEGVSELQQKVNQYTKQIDDLKKENQAIIQNRIETLNKLNQLESNLVQKEQTINALNLNINTIINEKQKLNSEIIQQNSQIELLKKNGQNLMDDLKNSQKETQRINSNLQQLSSEYNNNVSFLKQTVEQIKKELDLEKEKTKELNTRRDKLKSDYETLLEKNLEITQELKTTQEKSNTSQQELEFTIKTIKADKEAHELTIKNAVEYIQKLETYIKEISVSQNEKDIAYENMSMQLQEATTKIKALQDSLNTTKTILTKKKQKLRNILNKNKELTATIATVGVEKETNLKTIVDLNTEITNLKTEIDTLTKNKIKDNSTLETFKIQYDKLIQDKTKLNETINELILQNEQLSLTNTSEPRQENSFILFKPPEIEEANPAKNFFRKRYDLDSLKKDKAVSFSEILDIMLPNPGFALKLYSTDSTNHVKRMFETPLNINLDLDLIEPTQSGLSSVIETDFDKNFEIFRKILYFETKDLASWNDSFMTIFKDEKMEQNYGYFLKIKDNSDSFELYNRITEVTSYVLAKIASHREENVEFAKILFDTISEKIDVVSTRWNLNKDPIIWTWVAIGGYLQSYLNSRDGKSSSDNSDLIDLLQIYKSFITDHKFLKTILTELQKIIQGIFWLNVTSERGFFIKNNVIETISNSNLFSFLDQNAINTIPHVFSLYDFLKNRNDANSIIWPKKGNFPTIPEEMLDESSMQIVFSEVTAERLTVLYETVSTYLKRPVHPSKAIFLTELVNQNFRMVKYIKEWKELILKEYRFTFETYYNDMSKVFYNYLYKKSNLNFNTQKERIEKNIPPIVEGYQNLRYFVYNTLLKAQPERTKPKFFVLPIIGKKIIPISEKKLPQVNLNFNNGTKITASFNKAYEEDNLELQCDYCKSKHAEKTFIDTTNLKIYCSRLCHSSSNLN